MKVAPFRALTHVYVAISILFCLRGNEGRPFQGIDTFDVAIIPPLSASVEMKVAPFRALTHLNILHCDFLHIIVEMKVAPFRALTHFFLRIYSCFTFPGGNEGRPFQGIDTVSGDRHALLTCGVWK